MELYRQQHCICVESVSNEDCTEAKNGQKALIHTSVEKKDCVRNIKEAT
jgi:hypothetical protein